MTTRCTALAAALLVLSVGVARANTISGCSTTNKCDVGPAGELFCDVVCPGGSCATPLASAADNCPGHCANQPDVACVTDGPCVGSGGNGCRGTDLLMKRCIAGSPRAGEKCATDGQCNDPQDANNCHVSGTACCQLPGTGETYGGDGRVAVCGSNSVSTGDTITLGTPPAGTTFAVCGRNGDDAITGSAGDDVIDGGNGDDDLFGAGGTDVVIGGDGNDTAWGDTSTSADGGDDYVDGGDGDDWVLGTNRTLVGSDYVEGDNVLIGGPGNDLVFGGSGRDVMKGGDGDDTVTTIVLGSPAPPDDVLGNLLCGGAGDDALVGAGPSQQCMDGGDDADGCTYVYYVNGGTQGAHDLGTVRNCEADDTSRPVSCGCE